MSKPRPYFLLLARDNESTPFGVAFGDFDKEAVQFERQCYRDAGDRASNLKTVRVESSRKAACEAAVAKANA